MKWNYYWNLFAGNTAPLTDNWFWEIPKLALFDNEYWLKYSPEVVALFYGAVALLKFSLHLKTKNKALTFFNANGTWYDIVPAAVVVYVVLVCWTLIVGILNLLLYAALTIFVIICAYSTC